jgi:hypothetical protein
MESRTNHRLQTEALHNRTHTLNRTKINEALKNKQYYSAAALLISWELNEVWHTGLLYKVRLLLSLNYLLVEILFG